MSGGKIEHAVDGVAVAVGGTGVAVGTGVEVRVRIGVPVRVAVAVAAGVAVRVAVGGNGVDVAVGGSGVDVAGSGVAVGLESRAVGVTVRTGVGVRLFPPLAALAVAARRGAMTSRAATTNEVDVLTRMTMRRASDVPYDQVSIARTMKPRFEASRS